MNPKSFNTHLQLTATVVGILTFSNDSQGSANFKFYDPKVYLKETVYFHWQTRRWKIILKLCIETFLFFYFFLSINCLKPANISFDAALLKMFKMNNLVSTKRLSVTSDFEEHFISAFSFFSPSELEIQENRTDDLEKWVQFFSLQILRWPNKKICCTMDVLRLGFIIA